MLHQITAGLRSKQASDAPLTILVVADWQSALAPPPCFAPSSLRQNKKKLVQRSLPCHAMTARPVLAGASAAAPFGACTSTLHLHLHLRKERPPTVCIIGLQLFPETAH